ncbi:MULTISPECIES: hypothetical protein [Bacillaceae]|uniref:hypothetical protein n=1 Tax=Bacillaceae TaxID=186817 RepID=UPI000479C0CB|nr:MULTISPECIES: hypothetical protein [Bacillaceae]MBI0575907.1 hypothetical protein [Neobacillus cucumis]WHY90102.1 hypothetical protein QNK12_20810 [Neobacillus cucumis]
MPRGKELEQLPMSHIAPGAGKDAGKMDREVLGSIVQNEQPQPSEIERENEDMV